MNGPVSNEVYAFSNRSLRITNLIRRVTPFLKLNECAAVNIDKLDSASAGKIENRRYIIKETEVSRGVREE